MPGVIGERDWALFLGLGTYVTGKPCKHGHFAPRRTFKGVCVECQRLASLGKPYDSESNKAAKKRYRARHPDRVRAYDVARALANPTRIRDKSRRWRKANPDAVKAKYAARRAKEKEAQCSCCKPRHFRKVYAQATFGIHEVDHIVPLALGGAHCVKNLQILTIEDHRKKTAADNIAIRAARSNALLVSSG